MNDKTSEGVPETLVLETIAQETAEKLLPDLSAMILTKLARRVSMCDHALGEIDDASFRDILLDAVGDALARYAVKWREDAAKFRDEDPDEEGTEGVAFDIGSLVTAEARTRGIDEDTLDDARGKLAVKVEAELRVRLKPILGKPLDDEAKKEIQRITSEVMHDVFDELFTDVAGG
jgi:hypothetical protein